VLALQDLDVPVILAFLDHLETERSCCPRTRNLRLTAIRSFMRYASVRDPAQNDINADVESATIQQSLFSALRAFGSTRAQTTAFANVASS